MTIFDMLELLETEIVSLRGQVRDLRVALDQRSVELPKTKKRAGPAKKKAKKKAAKASKKAKAGAAKGANGKGEQMELPALAEPAEPQPETRSLGKRQALGKSLLQLRKTAAPRQL